MRLVNARHAVKARMVAPGEGAKLPQTRAAA
jgi:hypothetical protein